MRKSLECLAYAAIAPNKEEYAKFRAGADSRPDYTKDFHAGRILQALKNVNPDFYPQPVSSPVKIGPGKWHFDEREDKSLTKKQFETIYDRIGKFLHADNPWDHDKGHKNLFDKLPEHINSVRLLLSWHYTAIRSPHFNGVWVLEVPTNGAKPRVHVGQTEGEFIV